MDLTEIITARRADGNAAARKRRARVRARLGLIVVPVEIDEHHVAGRLIERGLLDERAALDRARLSAALAALVARWADGKENRDASLTEKARARA